MDENLMKIDGHDGLYKNSSGVVVNINKEDIKQVQKRRQESQLRKQEHKQLVETVKTLEGEMNEIKSLLTQLVEKI
jgi:hypothetical protein